MRANILPQALPEQARVGPLLASVTIKEFDMNIVTDTDVTLLEQWLQRNDCGCEAKDVIKLIAIVDEFGMTCYSEGRKHGHDEGYREAEDDVFHRQSLEDAVEHSKSLDQKKAEIDARIEQLTSKIPPGTFCSETNHCGGFLTKAEEEELNTLLQRRGQTA